VTTKISDHVHITNELLFIIYSIQYSLFYAFRLTSDICLRWSLIFVILFSELNTSNRRSDIRTVATFRRIYGLGKNRTSASFWKPTQTPGQKPKKEDMSGETRTYGNPMLYCYACTGIYSATQSANLAHCSIVPNMYIISIYHCRFQFPKFDYRFHNLRYAFVVAMAVNNRCVGRSYFIAWVNNWIIVCGNCTATCRVGRRPSLAALFLLSHRCNIRQ